MTGPDYGLCQPLHPIFLTTCHPLCQSLCPKGLETPTLTPQHHYPSAITSSLLALAPVPYICLPPASLPGHQLLLTGYDSVWMAPLFGLPGFPSGPADPPHWHFPVSPNHRISPLHQVVNFSRKTAVIYLCHPVGGSLEEEEREDEGDFP